MTTNVNMNRYECITMDSNDRIKPIFVPVERDHNNPVQKSSGYSITRDFQDFMSFCLIFWAIAVIGQIVGYTMADLINIR